MPLINIFVFFVGATSLHVTLRPAKEKYIEIQNQLDSLTQGKITKDGDFYEYVLPDETSQKSMHRFTQENVRQCLQTKQLHFLGDSRLRFLFAGVTDMLQGQNTTFPHHRACPDRELNKPGKYFIECKQYFRGGDGTFSAARSNYQCDNAHMWWHSDDDHGDFAPVAFNRWFQEHPKTNINGNPSHSPNTVLLNGGAYSRNVTQLSNFILDVSDKLRSSDPDALKIFVGYPACAFADKSNLGLHNLGELLETNGWYVYNPEAFTSPDLWRNTEFKRVWNPVLQPKEVLPKETKWDQCESWHTFDSLADLELQILLNVICDRD